MIRSNKGFSLLFLIIVGAAIVVGCLFMFAKVAPISINETPSTNSHGRELIVYANGSGQYRVGDGATISVPVGTFDRSSLVGTMLNWNLFQEVFISSIPRCPKSMSFGTYMSINFMGKQSGDISCLATNKSPEKEFWSQVNEMLNTAENYLKSNNY